MSFTTTQSSFLPAVASPKMQPSVKIQLNGRPLFKAPMRSSNGFTQRNSWTPVSTSTKSESRSQFSLTPVSSTSSVKSAGASTHQSFTESVDSRSPSFRSFTCLPTIPTKSSFKKGSRLEVKKTVSADISNTNYHETLAPLPNLGFTVENSKEECDARQNFTRKEVVELTSMQLLDENARYNYTNAQLTKELDKTFKLATQVLTNYSIEVRSYTQFAADSGMTIMPVAGRLQLANFYKMFIPEMCRFNYVFLSNLRIGSVSVCDSLELTNSQYAAIMDKKLHSGLFVMQKMTKKTSVQQHWFKVVLYHFLRASPEFYTQWRNFLLEELGVQSKATPFEELLVTFNHLMGTSEIPAEDDGIQSKLRMKFLKDALQTFHFEPEENRHDDC